MNELEKAPKDKRTKEYKDWVENYNNTNHDGLGDIVEKAINKTGIDKVVKFIAGEDCGCDKRKEYLNKSSKKVYNCFTEEQYNQWTDFRNRPNKNMVEPEHQKLVSELLAHVYKISIKPNCASCSGVNYVRWINLLDDVYNAY